MKKIYSFLTFSLLNFVAFSQIPNPCLVGYWQNWSPMKLSEIHANYNVIQLAFATTKSGTDYDMEFNLPSGYSKTTFLADIDLLHGQGKKIILSIGGASDPVILDNLTKKNTFISSINQILSDYSYKIDGIDLDLESTSLNFGSWTMSNPAQGQLNIIDAVKSIMNTYQTTTGRKLLLTMAPENVYIQGALSDWQVNNINGGAYLPIIEGLKNELDLLHPQYYNAGGATGGTFANNGTVYYDTGDPDYLTAITETLIKGFTLKANKGVFGGVAASKIAIGLPSNNCNAAGTGFVSTTDLCQVVKYFRGEITKPASFDYTITKQYPDLRGLMTWSINEDELACSGKWSFAENFTCAFGAVTGLGSQNTSSGFTIFPNSINSGVIEFSLESNSKEAKSLIIYNQQGNLIQKMNVEDNSFKLDLNKGLYLFSVEGLGVQKIVVY